MSTSDSHPPPVDPARQGVASARKLIESAGPHIGGSQGQTRVALLEALQDTPSLQHLGHYTGSDWDFAVDVEPGPEDTYDLAATRKCRTVGCILAAKLMVLASQLADVGTGALIRTVLHGEQGAVFINTVMQGERILGLARGRFGPHSARHPDVYAADQAIAHLITRLRASFGQPTQDPGGFRYLSKHPEQEWRGGPEEADATLEQRCQGVLDPQDLQFVALIRDGAVEFWPDLFDDPAMEPFFRAGYSVDLRRRFYREFALELPHHVRDLGRIAYPLIGRGIDRVVLDVQRGAIYYYRMDARSYLMGVTLNQFAVAIADLKMEWLSRPPLPA